MRASDITVGVTLKLKKERQNAYGMSTPFVYVTSVHTRNGYKTPWIQGRENDSYKPSDFAGFAGEKDA